MNRTWKITRFLALAGVAALTFVPRAEATSIEVVPTAEQIVPEGTVFDMSVVATGFGSTNVESADFTLSWNSSVISLTPTVTNPVTGFTLDPNGILGAVDLVGPTVTTIAGVTTFSTDFFATITPPACPAVGCETDPLTLASFSFLAANSPGFTVLTVAPIGAGGLLGGPNGNSDFPNVSIVNGSVCVTAPVTIPGPSVAGPNAPADPCALAPVPEPATFGLLATGLATVLARRRRKNQE